MINLISFRALTTPRLLLRQLKDKDEKEIFILRSDERILQFVDHPRATSITDAADFIQKINKGIATEGWLYWGITLFEQHDVIGTICLWNINLENEEAELGYVLHPDHQGKGLMQEAVTAVTAFAFNIIGFKALTAELVPDNLRSVNVLKRNNFKLVEHSSDTAI